MELDSEGTWSVTIPPHVRGFHYYYLNIDGVRVSVSASDGFCGVGRHSSGIGIPEAGADYYEIKNVPHGQIRDFRHFSKTVAGVQRQKRRGDVFWRHSPYRAWNKRGVASGVGLVPCLEA